MGLSFHSCGRSSVIDLIILQSEGCPAGGTGSDYTVSAPVLSPLDFVFMPLDVDYFLVCSREETEECYSSTLAEKSLFMVLEAVSLASRCHGGWFLVSTLL